MNEESRCWWTYSVGVDELILERTADRSVLLATVLHAVERPLLYSSLGWRLWNRVIRWCSTAPRQVEVIRIPITAEQRRLIAGAWWGEDDGDEEPQ